MASAKQIAWRKKFAKLYGKKKTGKKSTKAKTREPRSIAEIQRQMKNTKYTKAWIRDHPLYVKRFLAKYNAEFRKMSDASKKSFMRDHPKFVVRILEAHKA